MIVIGRKGNLQNEIDQNEIGRYEIDQDEIGWYGIDQNEIGRYVIDQDEIDWHENGQNPIGQKKNRQKNDPLNYDVLLLMINA